MTTKTEIRPYEQQKIKIYAYTLPQVPDHDGYIKVGDTNRDVDVRIKEQTGTAGLSPKTLWTKIAKRSDGTWFHDKQLHAYFKLNNIKQENFGTSANEWFYFNGTPEKAEQLTDKFIAQDYDEVQISDEKIDYILRSEQARAVEQTLEYAQSTQEPKEFLWNAKPRFGKTLTTYDFVRKLNAQNVLIVTNRPAIANSWFDDFKKFISWQEPDMKFFSETDSLKEKAMSRQDFINFCINHDNARQVAFISLQDLKGAKFAGGGYDKLEWVEKIHWDVLIIDEAHEGVDTTKTDVAFDKIHRDFTLHLSGTPFKALANKKFAENQIYNWSYIDEQEAKAEWNYANGNNPYENLPELSLFTYQMSKIIEDKISQGTEIIEGKNVDYAFDLNEFFKTKDNGIFEYEADIIKFLDNLSSGKFPFSESEYKKELNHTFWLLPRVASAKALESLLKQHPVFKDYQVVLAAGDGVSLEAEADDSSKNEKSFDKVKKAIRENEKTITLSVGQLTTGVTIPEWTAVLMLNNITSPALYFQAAFRAQNPYEFDRDGQHYRKERAYIFDFAPERTLKLFDEFAVNLSNNKDRVTPEERKKRIKKLLNFFPVIGEDSDGEMKELNAHEVLTIPNNIKSNEVVKRGFMSNLLFANISNIFNAPAGVREILEKLKPEKNKKILLPRNIPERQPLVNDEGQVEIPQEMVVNETKGIFGDKIFGAFSVSDNPEVNNIVTGITLKFETEKVFDNFQSRFDLKKGDTNKIKDNFKVAVTSVVEEEKKTYDTTIEETVKARDTEVQAVEEKTSELLSKTFELTKQQEILQQAEVKKQEIIEQAEIKKQEATQVYQEKVNQRVEEVAQLTVETQLEKVEDRKKREEENDVRDHLRGFARTIPAFLMAYGSDETTLANFEKNIDEDTFLELTSITIEEFMKLRDGFEYQDDEGNTQRFIGFFDEGVFNASVEAFFDKKRELANYFDESLKEDIFDYIPPQKTNQIFTPKKVVKMMVDLLEKENPDIFKNTRTKFIDLYTKSGLYLTEIVKRLNLGLKDTKPNERERVQWILENQVYAVAPSNIIYNIAKNYIFSEFKDISTKNIVECDLTPFAENCSAKEKLAEIYGDENLKFDVVIGNPPYQKEAKGESSSDDPIYNLFMEESYKIADKVSFITPARFLFNAGKTPRIWNEKMLSDKHLKVEFYEQDSSKVFPNTDIKGGVVVTYRDSEKDFGEIGVFTTFKELNSILSKVEKRTDVTLDTVISGRGIYRLTNTALQEHPEIEKIQSKGHKTDVGSGALRILSDIIFFEKKPNDGKEYVQVLGLLNNQRVFYWIDRRYLSNPENFEKYKVIVPKANGSGAIGEVLSTPLIGEPLVGFTETFISIGSLETEYEANAALKYVKSKFARTMLGILKITQDNPRDKWSKVPMQDFTPSSDVDWSKSIKEIDQQLYKKYGLDEMEIAFIEEKVKSME